MINTTYKLISKLNLKNTTYGQYFEKEQIDTERLKSDVFHLRTVL